MTTAGKLERRQQRDRARSISLKNPVTHEERGLAQEAISRANWETRKEQGQAGLPGAGRGGYHKSPLDYQRRPKHPERADLYAGMAQPLMTRPDYGTKVAYGPIIDLGPRGLQELSRGDEIEVQYDNRGSSRDEWGPDVHSYKVISVRGKEIEAFDLKEREAVTIDLNQDRVLSIGYPEHMITRRGASSAGDRDMLLATDTFAEALKDGKFEKGKPADPTKDMSPEDAAEWKRQTEEHKDNFKAAAGRPIHEIAKEIRDDWKKVYFGAVPYLDAMRSLGDISDNYGDDPASNIINYFLSNASAWRGPVAKKIKAELNAMVKSSRRAMLTFADYEADLRNAKFEEGKPADPTKHMSPEDAAEWKKQNEEHKDNFKSAASMMERMQLLSAFQVLATGTPKAFGIPRKDAIKAIQDITGVEIPEDAKPEGKSLDEYMDWVGSLKTASSDKVAEAALGSMFRELEAFRDKVGWDLSAGLARFGMSMPYRMGSMRRKSPQREGELPFISGLTAIAGLTPGDKDQAAVALKVVTAVAKKLSNPEYTFTLEGRPEWTDNEPPCPCLEFQYMVHFTKSRSASLTVKTAGNGYVKDSLMDAVDKLSLAKGGMHYRLFSRDREGAMFQYGTPEYKTVLEAMNKVEAAMELAAGASKLLRNSGVDLQFMGGARSASMTLISCSDYEAELDKESKFEKGKSMTPEQVSKVVGPEFAENVENPPDAVKKLQEEMKTAEWKGWDEDMPVQIASEGGTEVFENLAAAKKKHPELDPKKGSKGFTWAMRGEVKGKPAIRFEDKETYRSISRDASDKEAKLMARQVSILKKYVDEAGSGAAFEYGDLPQIVQGDLARVKDQETLEMDVNRWLGDNKTAGMPTRPSGPAKGQGRIYEGLKKGDIIYWNNHEFVIDKANEDGSEVFFSQKGTGHGQVRTDLRGDPAYQGIKSASMGTAPESDKTAAAGLYGFTKAAEKACGSAATRLAKFGAKLAKDIYSKSAETPAFLEEHAKRTGSRAAKMLRKAMADIGPGQPGKTAARGDKGRYGFSAKTAKLALEACHNLEHEAGVIACDLDSRMSTKHATITGYLGTHAKKAKCGWSEMIMEAYPPAPAPIIASDEATKKTASGLDGYSVHPSVEELLMWNGSGATREATSFLASEEDEESDEDSPKC